MTIDTVTRVLTGDRELSDVRTEWEELWSADPNATMFQHPAWLAAWWRAFHPGTLHVVAVRSGGALIALAPLYLETSGVEPRLMPIGVSLSDYTDILVHPAQRTAGLDAIARALADPNGRWRRAEWDEVGPFGHILALPAHADLTTEGQQATPCPVLVLPEAAEGLAKAVPSRKLRKARMALHRLERRQHELVRHTAESCPSFVQTLQQLHTARWNSRGEPGVFIDGLLVTFLSDALPAMLADGLANATTLSIEGRVAAAYLGFQRGAMACAYMGGFDPVFAFESPGTVLLHDALERAVQAGVREFHFLRGGESYKYEWGAEDRVNRRISICRANAPHA